MSKGYYKVEDYMTDKDALSKPETTTKKNTQSHTVQDLQQNRTPAFMLAMDAAQANVDRPANHGEHQLDGIQLQEADLSLEHASSCDDADCSQPVCTMIKDFKIHFTTCEQRTSCAKCKYLLQNYGYHAQACTDVMCQKPYCYVMKQKLTMIKCVRNKRRYAVELLLHTIATDRRNNFVRTRDKQLYAKKAEKYSYHRAFTQSEYYRLLAVQRWHMEMDLEEREEDGLVRGQQSVAVQTVAPVIPETN